LAPDLDNDSRLRTATPLSRSSAPQTGRSEKLLGPNVHPDELDRQRYSRIGLSLEPFDAVAAYAAPREK
jgi:hypothetical protein